MGRKKEWKASKSFTLGISEIAFMEEHCYELNIKGSEYVNKLIRKEMLNSQDKERQQHGPINWCTSCGDNREYAQFHNKDGNVRWGCKECGDDKTEVIKYLIEQQSAKLK
jgi:hypothetical protein